MEQFSQRFLLSLPICLGLALGCAKGAEIGPGQIVILSEEPADAGLADAAMERGTASQSSAPSDAPAAAAPAAGVTPSAAASEMAAAAAVLMPTTPSPADPRALSTTEDAPTSASASEVDAGVDAASATSAALPPALDAGR